MIATKNTKNHKHGIASFFVSLRVFYGQFDFRLDQIYPTVESSGANRLIVSNEIIRYETGIWHKFCGLIDMLYELKWQCSDCQVDDVKVETANDRQGWNNVANDFVRGDFLVLVCLASLDFAAFWRWNVNEWRVFAEFGEEVSAVPIGRDEALTGR